MSGLSHRAIALRLVFAAFGLYALTGCDKLKGMLQKNDVDAAAAPVDAGADVAVAPPVVEDAGPPDAGPVVQSDDLPTPDGDESRANRDIGFGNYKDELDKIEKEVNAPPPKKK